MSDGRTTATGGTATGTACWRADSTTPSTHWDAARGQINYQVAEGCSIDQVAAQWHANISGLGEIFDPGQRRTALRSVWRYNFGRATRYTFNPRRVFSLNDESGVLTCLLPARPAKYRHPVRLPRMHAPFEWSLCKEFFIREVRALVLP